MDLDLAALRCIGDGSSVRIEGNGSATVLWLLDRRRAARHRPRRMQFSANSVSTTCPAQNRHPCPALMLVKQGDTSCPHLVHLHFQGRPTPGKSTKGMSSAFVMVTNVLSRSMAFLLQ